jgi:hypothetical protein
VLLSFSHRIVIAGWSFLVVAALAARVALGGMPGSAMEVSAWLLLVCVPVAIVLVVFRGAPPATIGQVLYDAEHPPAAPGTTSTLGHTPTRRR